MRKTTLLSAFVKVFGRAATTQDARKFLKYWRQKERFQAALFEWIDETERYEKARDYVMGSGMRMKNG